MNLLAKISTSTAKPIRFALWGALGCFLAALILGELILLLLTAPPSTGGRSIALVIDTSGSMGEIVAGNPQPTGQTIVEDGKTYNLVTGGKSKLQFVQESLQKFVNSPRLTAADQLAIITFNSGADTVQGLTSAKNTSALESAINQLSNPSGSTNIEAGINAARGILNSVAPPRGIVLFTDGVADNPEGALSAASSARGDKVTIVAVATTEADTNFLNQVTGDPKLVFSTSSTQIDEAFQKAEEAITSRTLTDSGAVDQSPELALLRTGLWTGALATGLALCLIIGQNLYMKRRPLSLKEGLLGGGGGFVAGLVAGSAGQILFQGSAMLLGQGFPYLYLAEIGIRILAWVLLGGLLGGGVSFFIPNLKIWRGLQGGLLGGLLGGIAFLVIASFSGDLVARLMGAAILGFFIGLMLALIEVLTRKAWIVVHWNKNERRQINLGEQAVLFGSSAESDVYLRKDKGFPPKAARISFANNQVVLDDLMKETQQVLTPGSKVKLGNVLVEVQVVEEATPSTN